MKNLSVLVSLWLISAPAGAGNLPITFDEIKAAYDQVQDYTCTFSKVELIDNEMQREQILMLFRKPFSVKFAWLNPKKGQHAVYQQGKNDNKLRARKGGFL